LVNSQLNTNDWRQVNFPNPDITIIHLEGPAGQITIANIYNDADSDVTLLALTRFCQWDLPHICSPEPGLLWAGNFNWKHPT
ncbi:hypothetical protein NEOLEDRAFT_1080114, partial [Neolentinus lepideus HHB14362 ss-1]